MVNELKNWEFIFSTLFSDLLEMAMQAQSEHAVYLLEQILHELRLYYIYTSSEDRNKCLKKIDELLEKFSSWLLTQKSYTDQDLEADIDDLIEEIQYLQSLIFIYRNGAMR